MPSKVRYALQTLDGSRCTGRFVLAWLKQRAAKLNPQPALCGNNLKDTIQLFEALRKVDKTTAASRLEILRERTGLRRSLSRYKRAWFSQSKPKKASFDTLFGKMDTLYQSYPTKKKVVPEAASAPGMFIPADAGQAASTSWGSYPIHWTPSINNPSPQAPSVPQPLEYYPLANAPLVFVMLYAPTQGLHSRTVRIKSHSTYNLSLKDKLEMLNHAYTRPPNSHWYWTLGPNADMFNCEVE